MSGLVHFFTDFGLVDSYVGEMEAAAFRTEPSIKCVNLTAHAPDRDPKAAAYYLAALIGRIRAGEAIAAVVDPGVGSERLPLALLADGVWLVGPDNGLMELVARRADMADWFQITYRPEHLSASFHGRDIFAPVAARLAVDDRSDLQPLYQQPDQARGWPHDLSQVIRIDTYGNAITGMRYTRTPEDATALLVGNHQVTKARTFSDVEPGQGFWYRNSAGLVEIAVNMGRADTELGIVPGMTISFI